MFKQPIFKQPIIFLLAGAFALYFVGWGHNLVVAPWIAFTLLLFHAREMHRWKGPLTAFGVLTLATFATLHGGWDMPVSWVLGFGALKTLPLLLPLWIDRALAGRLSGWRRTLVFPLALTVFDYFFAFMPGLGSTFSPAPTQFAVLPLAQVASLTGIWGITFLMGWGASVVVEFRTDRRPAAAFAVTMAAVLAYGSALSHSIDHDVETVRVAGITVEHPRDYWTDIIDAGSPPEDAPRFADELQRLEDDLFAESLAAVQGGAKIILWSEGNAVMYPDHEPDFVERAQAFARVHGVWMVLGTLVARNDDIMSDNTAFVIDDQGKVLTRYLKTMSWYPTESDGQIPVFDSPWGRLGVVICFDMDFPGWLHSGAKDGVDIMLVPAFDTKAISPYHTHVGLMRGIENGMSIVRQVNHGTSMAIDSSGKVLAMQDFYQAKQRLMFADVPTRGRTTLYRLLGDWFAFASMLGLAVLVVMGPRRD